MCRDSVRREKASRSSRIPSHQLDLELSNEAVVRAEGSPRLQEIQIDIDLIKTFKRSVNKTNNYNRNSKRTPGAQSEKGQEKA